MNKKLILIIAILFATQQLFAQALPQNINGGCVIKYDYDAGGNRIKRSKYCLPAGGYVQRPAKQGVNKITDIEMQVHPNPASTSFSVVFNQEINNAVVELQDIAGKVIASKQIAGSNTTFNIQYISQGAYLVVLKRKDTKEVMVRKLVKE